MRIIVKNKQLPNRRIAGGVCIVNGDAHCSDRERIAWVLYHSCRFERRACFVHQPSSFVPGDGGVVFKKNAVVGRYS